MSEDDVMALDQAILHTENEFVDAMTAFEGPLARDLLAMMDADLTDTVILTASNDYAIEVPVSDFFDYDVVLALSTDGTRLSMRDKGPIWVVYPISDHSELDDPVYNARLIWQLVRMDIK
ncbi:MAG: hypothetical protein JKY31_10645 [Rhodobacteraceae bacterium]|nr:hypothetical protein [Paracoccaceae bacterium]